MIALLLILAVAAALAGALTTARFLLWVAVLFVILAVFL